LFVIAGLDPAIHPLRRLFATMMDARVKPAHDGGVWMQIALAVSGHHAANVPAA
jgi:hypothetical protein